MDVSGLNSIRSTPPVQNTRPAAGPREVSEARPVSSPQDAVEISSAGKMLEETGLDSEFRAERLAQIKAAIDDGTYESAEKLEAALSRMMNSLMDE